MKTLKISLLTIAFLAAFTMQAQVAVSADGSSSHNSAMLEVKSTSKGFLPPRMTEAQRNSIYHPATGLMIYQTDRETGLYLYNGTFWNAVSQLADGSETKITAGTNITVTGTGTTASPYVVNAASVSAHYVGELYGGGVVFWVDQTGSHGLIVSMIDLSTAQAWSNINTELIGTTAQSDWNGQGNSNAIMTQTGQTTSAAKLCGNYINANYGTGVYSDWYLPSRGELIDLYCNLKAVQKALDTDGNSATTEISKIYYWSSTELRYNVAWAFLFTSGSWQFYDKGITTYVRAVRDF